MFTLFTCAYAYVTPGLQFACLCYCVNQPSVAALTATFLLHKEKSIWTQKSVLQNGVIETYRLISLQK